MFFLQSDGLRNLCQYLLCAFFQYNFSICGMVESDSLSFGRIIFRCSCPGSEIGGVAESSATRASGTRKWTDAALTDILQGLASPDFSTQEQKCCMCLSCCILPSPSPEVTEPFHTHVPLHLFILLFASPELPARPLLLYDSGASVSLHSTAILQHASSPSAVHDRPGRHRPVHMVRRMDSGP